MPRELAAIAQREPKGRRFVIRDRRTGFLYEMLLTYRKPRATAPHGAYQATYYHHDPTATIGRNNKTNRLACTRELLCSGEGGDAAIVASLSKWACAADEFSDRRGHMRTRRCRSVGDADDSDDSSSISTGQIPSDVSVSIDSSAESPRKALLAPPLRCWVSPSKSLCARDRRDGIGTPYARMQYSTPRARATVHHPTVARAGVREGRTADSLDRSSGPEAIRKHGVTARSGLG